MKIILFIILGIGLTLAISFSLFLFGVDQSLYSWRFFSNRLNEISTILTSEAVHKQVVRELVDPLVKSMGEGVPSQLSYMIEEAALLSFSANWIVDTGGDAIKAVQALLKRKSSTLDFSLSLQTFKNNIAVILHRSERFKEREIQLGLREIPDQITLKEIMPTPEYERVIKLIKTYPLYSNALMYGLPLLFLFLCFLWSSLKSGIIISGVSFFTGASLIQGGRIFLEGHSTRVAGLFLSSKNVQTFSIPLKAAALDFSHYLKPVVSISYLTAIIILIGGLFLDRALKRGEVLDFLNKIKNSHKKKKKNLPWS